MSLPRTIASKAIELPLSSKFPLYYMLAENAFLINQANLGRGHIFLVLFWFLSNSLWTFSSLAIAVDNYCPLLVWPKGFNTQKLFFRLGLVIVRHEAIFIGGLGMRNDVRAYDLETTSNPPATLPSLPGRYFLFLTSCKGRIVKME